jgi:vacuolar-type H+-ATPase subunit C/Vma6
LTPSWGSRDLSQIKRYSSVLAKIGSERSYLLTGTKLKTLAQCKNLTEFASELKETRYSERLAKIPLPYSARKFERLFRENLIETYGKIVQNAPKTSLQFLKMYVSRFEYDNIKIVLRAVHIGLPYEEILRRIYLPAEDFLRNRKVFEKAAEAIDIRSVISLFMNKPYWPALSVGLRKYEETKSMKFFDFLLDKMYYENLVENYENLSKKEQKHAFFYASLETDGFVLLTVLRGKILDYDSDSLRMAIPHSYFDVSEKIVEDALLADGFESALIAVMRSHYDKFFVRAESPEKAMSHAEKELRKAMLAHAEKNRIAESFNLEAPLGFMVEKEAETTNLSALSLGIEYGWKPADIIETLLMPS